MQKNIVLILLLQLLCENESCGRFLCRLKYKGQGRLTPNVGGRTKAATRPLPFQIKMGKKKSKGKQKKRKGPIQRAPAQAQEAQDNQSESSSSSRSRSPQSGESASNYEEQQPGTSGANDAAPVSRLEDFNNTMNLGFVFTLLNDIKPALLLIDQDAGIIDHRPLISGLLERIDDGLAELILRDPQDENPQVQRHRLTLHDLRVHLQAAFDDYEDFVRRGARPGAIADETDVEDEAGPSGCNAPSDDVDLDEPGPSKR